MTVFFFKLDELHDLKRETALVRLFFLFGSPPCELLSPFYDYEYLYLGTWIGNHVIGSTFFLVILLVAFFY